MRVEFDKDYCGKPHLHVMKVGMVLTFEQTTEQLKELHDAIGEYLQFHCGLTQAQVEALPLEDAPKVEGAQCVANFIIKPFDPSEVKRNPFYFGDSKTTNEPVTQADGVADNKDTCVVCGKEIPPGPDTCSDGCERLWVTSAEYREAQIKKGVTMPSNFFGNSVLVDEFGTIKE